MAGRVRITQTKSQIGTKPDQRATLVALGLGRINQSREYEDRPEVRGMASKVAHLVKIEEI
ncbi:MAG: 50S ribosomal protein L30 [Actinobacteria bacterium]|nr:MAG: 50S ribosomal protein L30 [Actinomycetota bacterium]